MKGLFLDSILSKVENLDGENLQAFIHKLVKYKDFLEIVFNAVKEGIVVIDRSLSIRYNNRSAAEMLGIPEYMKDIKISAFLKDIDWGWILQRDKHEWDRISRQEIEIFYPVNRVLGFYIVPHGDEDDLATIILSDITEKIKSQKETIESEKVALMSMLAAGVAHEIGNPLNSLNIHLQLMERDFKGKMDSEGIEILQTCQSEVKRLDLIISQFLGAIRPVKLNYEPIDIQELLLFTLEFMKNELDESHIGTGKNFLDACPIIQGDHNQLKQAFFNIIKNAMQAMPTGGMIWFDIFIDYEKDKLNVSITDSGHGISAADIPNIFEPYFTKKKKGTGLGLMIVEKIIREHGAELTVESEPGKGARFIISFPLKTNRLKLLGSNGHKQ
ncbi:MAG: hypothetical protein A2X47_09405 [Lentisphaerae bacterium GWF2_38_69]|nr:MAG: hypothetical protein A2X47_09405 [Lentisphaerae bacterium GWF2_38_69]